MWYEITEFIKDIFKYIILIAVIVMVRIFVLTSTEVVGDSMEPNYHNGNMILVDQTTKYFDHIKRFDLVVVKYDQPSYIIKRVIGLPGEIIVYKEDSLYVDGKLVLEDFKVNGHTYDLDKEIKVPEDSYFVLGDNREDSEDSRYIGSISEEDILGKLFFQIWPLEKIGIVK